MKRDLLAELYNGVVSLEDSSSIFEAILSSQAAPQIKEILGFSDIEYTAYGHGVALDQIAKWRYEGWPNTCAKCGRAIRLEHYGWWAKKEKERGLIYHVECL